MSESIINGVSPEETTIKAVINQKKKTGNANLAQTTHHLN